MDIKLNPNETHIPAHYNILSNVTKQTELVQRSYIHELHTNKCCARLELRIIQGAS